MRLRFLRIAGAVCAIVLTSISPRVYAAQVVRGTVLASPAGSDSVKVQTDDKVMVIKRGKSTTITRGQIGKETRPVALRELAPGDLIVATIENGQPISLKSYYGLVRGIFERSLSDSIIMKDGRVLAYNRACQFILPDGKIGKAADIKSGSLIICRINPYSNEAWTVVSTIPVTAPPTAARPKANPPALKPIVNATAPEITSITYSAPVPMKSGDLMTVDLAGTPDCKASFAVKGLIPPTPMAEVSSGSYRAEVKIPGGQSVANAAVVGHLVLGKNQAKPVQAGRLVTIGGTPTAPVPALGFAKPRPIQAPIEPEPVREKPVYVPPAPKPAPAPAPAPAPVVHVEQPKPAPAKIVLNTPPDGAKIRRALLVRGTADPDSTVRITVTYANGLTGLLKLSGQVASENVAVGKDGTFRIGPMPLEGPLATPGLQFTVKAFYPDRADHCTAEVKVTGDRN